MAIVILVFLCLLVAPKCSTLELSENGYKSPIPLPTTLSLDLYPPPPPYLPVPPPHASFEFLMLALTWPASFCKLQGQGCVPPSPAKFSIHGLWPQNNTGTQPAFCKTNQKFILKQLISGNNPVSLTDLNTYWPCLNLKNKGDDKKFWGNEWRKHGSCSSMAIKDYFHLTFQIYLKNDLKSILQMNGITPGGPKRVNSTEIFNAVKAATTRKPKIVCASGYLLEIRLCLDKTGVRYIDCVPNPPSEHLVKCQTLVYFP